MEPTVSFGYWLRRRRKALDLTQAELAQCVGCATGTIKHIEADERRPSRQMAARLAECLCLPAEEHSLHQRGARRTERRSSAAVDSAAATGCGVDRIPVRTLPPPSGTVTFLFTDIEGSIQLWSSTRMLCTRPSPATMRFCDRPSQSIMVIYSRLWATRSMPRSPAHPTRLLPRSPRSARC